MKRYLTLLSVIFLLAATPASYAFVLDWGSATPGLTNGDTDHTFVNVDGSGIDIRVRVTLDTDFINSTPNVVALGAPVNENAYQVFMNWADDNDRIRVEVEFFETGSSLGTRAEVRNLVFSIYDIDRRGSTDSSGVDNDTPVPTYVYQDQIRTIRARTPTVNYGSSNIYPDITSGAGGTGAVAVANSGTASATITGQGYYDNENPKARADLSFDQDIAGLRFIYGNGPSFSGNPAGQTILFGGITFQAIPEPGTWVAGAVLAFLLFSLHSRRPLARKG